jgi:putative tricarboxylic transport membrane protein
LRLSRDGWAGLAVLAASLFLFALTLDLKDSPLVPIGPGYYPRIVLGLTAVLAAALVLSDLVGKKKRESTAAARANYGTVVLHFALFGLYVLALPGLGFRLATFGYIAVANALLERPKTAKGWARVGAVALVATAVAYLVFERYLFVLLPRGRWSGF